MDNVGLVEYRFAQNVRRFREQQGSSQLELAILMQETGYPAVHQTTISRIEKGERPVRLSEAIGISEVLRVPLDALLASPESAELHDRLLRGCEMVEKRRKGLEEATHWLVDARTRLEVGGVLAARDQGITPDPSEGPMTTERLLAIAERALAESTPADVAERAERG